MGKQACSCVARQVSPSAKPVGGHLVKMNLYLFILLKKICITLDCNIENIIEFAKNEAGARQ